MPEPVQAPIQTFNDTYVNNNYVKSQDQIMKFRNYLVLENCPPALAMLKALRAGKLRITPKKLFWNLVYLLIAVGSVAIALLLTSRSAQAAWFDDNWAYRTSLTIGNTGGADADKKVKFDIDTATLLTAGKIQADCGDSRFTDASGNLLDYYLDSAGGACNTASTDYYVLVPTINSGNTFIYHYYGNPTAANGTVAAQFSESTFSPTSGPTAGSEEKGAGPVAYWKFDECQGTTANDASGNGNSGTITPGASGNLTAGTCGSGVSTEMWADGTTGKYNASLGFDGADDYVSKTSPVGLPSGANPFTSSMWIKTSSGTSNIYLLKWGTGGTSNTMNALIYYGATNSFSHAFYSNDLSSGANTLTSGAWNHIVATFDGTTRRTYVNGRQTAQDTPAGVNVTANQTLWISTYTGAGNFFSGQIDDVRVYNYALTATQVQQLFNQGAGVRFGPNVGTP
mgnify:CR=1 FL=1